MNRYLRTFIDQHITSFSEIPVTLLLPNRSPLWAITWNVSDGDFVVSNQLLATASPAAGGEAESFTAVMPGRIHILIPDGPFVPEFSMIGVLEYGLRLDPFFAAEQSERELKMLKADAGLRAAKAQYRNVSAEYAPLKAETAAAEEAYREAVDEAERLTGELRDLENMRPGDAVDSALLLEILSRRIGAAASDNTDMPPLIFSLYARLKQRFPAGEQLPEQAAESLGLLYDHSRPNFEPDSPEISETDLQLQRHCWEQIRQSHLEHFRAKLGLPPSLEADV